MPEDDKRMEYKERINRLEKEIAYYREENARLLSQNEVLHETAWNLVLELRELKTSKTKNAESDKKD